MSINMKRTNLILFALFLLLSTGQLWAQEQKPYKPASTFKGDTLRYLEYNYAIRGEQYKGKTVEVILKELEYPILYIAGFYQVGGDGPSQLKGVCLVVREIMKQSSATMDYYIVVGFENPPTIDEYNEVSGRKNDNPFPAFSQKLYDFLKDLRISSVSTNSFLFKDSENIKAWKDKQKRQREKQYEVLKQAGMPEAEIKEIKKRFKD